MCRARVVLFLALLAVQSASAATPVVQLGRAGADDGPMAAHLQSRRAATSNDWGRVQLWDVATRRRLEARAFGPSPIQSLAFAGNGQALLVRTLADVQLWNIASGAVTTLTPRAPARAAQGVVDLAISEDLSTVASGSCDGAGCGVRIERKDARTTLSIPPENLALSASGRFVAALQYGVLTVRDTQAKGDGKTALEQIDLRAHRAQAPPLFDGEERRVAAWIRSAGEDIAGRVVWLDVATGDRRELAGGSPQFLPDGRLLYLDPKGCLHLRRWPDEDRRSPAPCRSDARRQFAVVGDGVVLSAGVLFEAESGERIGSLRSPARPQRVTGFDEAAGLLDVDAIAALDAEWLAWFNTPFAQSGGADSFRWNLATGAREPQPFAPEASCLSIRDVPGELRFDGQDHKRYRLDGAALSVCNPKTGGWARVFPRQGPEPRFARVLRMGRTWQAVILDAAGQLETWSLKERRLESRAPFPGTLWTLVEACVLGKDLWLAVPGGVFVQRGKEVALRYPGTVNAAVCDAAGGQLAVASPAGIDFLRLDAAKDLHLDTGGELPQTLAWGPKGRLYAGTEDGGLWVIDPKAPRVVATLYALGEQDSVITTPEGDYFASRGAVASVDLRDGATSVPAALADVILNRPEKVLPALGYASDRQLQELDRIVKLRLARQGPPPRLSEVALSWTPPPLFTRERTVSLSLRTSAAASGALHLTVNEVPLPIQSDWAGTARTDPIILTPGENHLRAWLTFPDGSQTRPLEAFVHALPKDASRPKTWFVGVGVSDYAAPGRDLRFAAKDVRDAAAAWQAQLGTMVETRLLLDGEATRSAIASLDAFVARAAPEDRLVLYFAGHGVIGDDHLYYFAPTDMAFDAPSKRGVPYAEIERLLNRSPARDRMVLIDSCHSGDASDADTAPKATLAKAPGEDGLVVARGARRAGDVPLAARAVDTLLVEDLFLDLREGTGAHVIAAAGAAEFALESPQWNNGLFTWTVLDALATKQPDADANGEVDTSELRRHVSRTVARLTQGRQLPTSRAESARGGFAVLTARDPDGERPVGRVEHLIYSGDGQRLLTLSQAGLRRFDKGATAPDKTLPLTSAQLDNIIALAVDGPGERVAWLAGAQRTLWVADVTGGAVRSLGDSGEGRHGPLTPLALSLDGTTLAARADGCGIVLWTLTDADPKPRVFPSSTCLVDALAFGDDGRLVVVESSGRVTWLDLQTGETSRWQLPHPSGPDAEWTEPGLGQPGSLGMRGRYYARTLGGAKTEDVRVAVWDLSQRTLAGTVNAPGVIRAWLASGSARLVLSRGDLRVLDVPSLKDRDWLGAQQVAVTVSWFPVAVRPDGGEVSRSGWNGVLSWALPTP